MTTPPPPVYPAWPPPTQPFPPPGPTPRRRWPAIATAAALGAALAGTLTTVLILKTTPTATVSSPTVVTVTASPTTAATLPADQADKQTCHGWRTARPLITAAAVAQGVIPAGMTITSPEVQTNPDWSAGVTKASQLYQQASDILTNQTAGGTSRLLADLSATAAAALHTLSIAYATYDPANGNIMTTFTETEKAMDALCP